MLIVAAKCEEAWGALSSRRMATAYRTVDAFVETITANPVLIDQWQLEECAKACQAGRRRARLPEQLPPGWSRPLHQDGLVP